MLMPKFRAWNKKEKQMYESGGTPTMLSFFFDKHKVSFVKDYIKLMPFTGLCDKSGREIYEKDIVFAPLNGEKYEVCFGEYESYCDDFKEKHYGWFIDNRSGNIEPLVDAEKYLEVIGNVFENKELLEG